MSDSDARLFRLFAAALRIHDPQKRAAYLDDACAGNADLRRRVENMLRQGRHEEGIKTKNQSNINPSVVSPPARIASEPAGFELRIGSVLAGKYSIEELLGEGGMGRVYRAKQVLPVRREVAVKILKAEMESKAFLSRFSIESQSLAMMDHPNIAQVFDAGATEAGCPFFVMELVRGVPITTFCDEQRYSIKQRLKLFIPVCEALQHAHQKGVIHRDIKPSNVLVANFEGRPVPKVIDFGLAKATSDASSEGGSENSLGVVLGTPEYMSPEQADFVNRATDTRSDVYSLGSLLFELIVGKPHLDRRKDPEASMFDLLRRVREESVPNAVEVIRSDRNFDIAKARGTTPGRLVHAVKGELEAILAKALNKSLDGRYESAIELARDLEHHLKGEFVQAVSPTPRYRLSKFLRGNRFVVACTFFAVLTLVGGLLVVGYGWARINRLVDAETRARLDSAAERQKAMAALTREQALADKIRVQLERIDKRNEILTSIFTDLDRARSGVSQEPIKAVLSKRLLSVAAKIDEQELGDPSAAAELRHNLGVSLRNCGYPREAIPLLQSAARTRRNESGPVHPETLASMEQLGQAYRDAGELDQAIEVFREVLRKRNASLGEKHADSLRTAAELADCIRAAGKVSEAIELLEKVRGLQIATLGAIHPQSLKSTRELASLYRADGDIDRALTMLRDCREKTKALFGDRHTETAHVVHELAASLCETRSYEGALIFAEEAVRIRSDLLGSVHPDTVSSMRSLATVYRALGDGRRALELLEAAHRSLRDRLGNEHVITLETAKELATLHAENGRVEDAVPLRELLLQTRMKHSFPGDPEVDLLMGQLLENHLSMKRHDKALEMAIALHQHQVAKYGEVHAETLVGLQRLSKLRRIVGDYENAIQGFRLVLHHWRNVRGLACSEAIAAQSELACAFFEAQKYDEAFFVLNDLSKVIQSKGKQTTLTVDPRLATNQEINWRVPALDEPTQIVNQAYRETIGFDSCDWIGFALLVVEIRKGEITNADMHLGRLVSRRVGKVPLRRAGLGAVALISWGIANRRFQSKLTDFYAECLVVCEKHLPEHWVNDQIRIKLGAAELAIGCLDEAERSLLLGYDGISSKGALISLEHYSQLNQCFDRLAKLYAISKKPEEVRRWQSEKLNLTTAWMVYRSMN